EQLAGDELAASMDVRASADLWVATGMHRCGPFHVTSGNVDAEVLRQEMLTEMVQGVGSAVLGLTVNCARCHDHKFDPLSQGDYSRLEASSAAPGPRGVDSATAEEPGAQDAGLKPLRARITALRGQVSAIDEPYRHRLAEAKRAALEPHYREAL